MLIIGLGNIGSKYENTRHNIGFMVIDSILKDIESSQISKKEFKGELNRSNSLFFLKPSTFMNLSGESAIVVKNFYKLEQVIVIHDDLDLGFGAIKFKLGGSHGGHNGLKSLDSHIGREYIRVRVGIGKPEYKHQVSNFVLERFNEQEQKHLDSIIADCKEAIFKLIDTPLAKVASTHTKKAINFNEASK